MAQCIRTFKYLTKKLINLFGCHQPVCGFPQPHPTADSVSEWILCLICLFSFFRPTVIYKNTTSYTELQIMWDLLIVSLISKG